MTRQAETTTQNTSTPRNAPVGGRPAAGERPPMMGGPGRRGPGGRGPGGHMMMKGEKARDFKGTMRKLIVYLGQYKVALIAVAIVAALSTAANIAGPKILGNATTTLFEGVMAQLSGTGEIDFDAIGRIVLSVLALYVASALFSYIQGWVMANISTNIAYRFRQDIAAKINRMPLKYFDTTTHGEVLSRITNDVDTVNQTLSQSLTQIITSVFTVVGVLVMMLSISWLMTLVALLMIPLSLGIVGLIIGRSQKYFKQQQDYLGHVNGHVEEMYGGHVVMKAFNGEAKSIAKFDESNTPLHEAAWKSQFLSGLMMPLMMFVGNLGYVAVAILGGWLAARNAITVGDIQAFIQYVRSFTQPITQLANISNVLQQTAAAAERVFEFLAEPEEIVEAAEPVKLETVDGHVEFKDVHFGYSAGQSHHQRLLRGGQARPEDRHRRADGRGQDHDGQAADALLRRERRRDPGGRARHPRLHPPRPAQDVRDGVAGYLALQRLNYGEHPLRTPGRNGRRGGRGGARPRTSITSSTRCRTATRWNSTRKRATSRRGRSSC